MIEEGGRGGNQTKGNPTGEKAKVYLEDITFLNLEHHHEVPFKYFLEKLKDDLKKDDYTYMEKKLTLYKNKKIQAQELFDCFYEVFGLKEVN